MRMEMVVKNDLLTNRFITDYGMTSYQLERVDLIIQGDVDNGEGFMVNMTEIRALFDEMIGECWNHAVIMEDGTHSEVTDSEVVYVDFSPSLENIAEYVYETMVYEIMRKFNVLLVGVMSVSKLGDIYYSPELARTECKK